MSYISNIKKLLADDLKGLITHVTGHQEGSPEFKRCEDTSWSFIVDHYYPAVHDLKVKSTLYEFVDKFKVHGFPQKAKNLKILIEAYSELEYFKKYSGVGIQWGLIDFLIKLSFKPTSAFEDDPPLNLKEKTGKNEELFNWGAYLKEGNEKFRLPSDDEESWVEEEIVQKDPITVSVGIQPSCRSLVIPTQSEPTACDLNLEALKRAEVAAEWLELHTHGFWWKNPYFREIPESKRPEANYCIIWEEMCKHNGTLDNETRVLSEYKVVMELLHVLSSPSSCYFIKEISKDCFKPIPAVSICSISPDMFSVVIEENFCVYLSYIKKLQMFCSEMETINNFSSSIPCTFRAYGCSLKKILGLYRKKLEDIERKVEAKDSVTTIRYLLKEIAPWLNQIEYLCKVHESAIALNYKEKDCRSNALKLLSVLYSELKHTTKWRVGDSAWQKNTILCILMDALKPFFSMLACHLAGKNHEYFGSEFFLCRSGAILVDSHTDGSEELWKPVLQLASSAIVSYNFLTVLGKESSFFINNFPTDILHTEAVTKLSSILLLPEIKIENEEDLVLAYIRKEELFPPDVRQKFFHSGHLMDHVFREAIAPRPKLIKPTITDSLRETLKDVDLSSTAVHIYLKEAILSVIEDYMEPKGFAADILLGQFKLLEHLNALYTTLQLTSFLSTVLITESCLSKSSKNVRNMRMNKCFQRFKDCILSVLSPDYVKNIKFQVSSSIFEKKNISLLDKPDFFLLNYQVNQEIKLIINDDIINGYTEIFRYLLKIGIALDTVKRLAVDFIEETEENILRFRQLCSLRMWLIHTLYTLSHYFSTYTNTDFQNKIRDLCLKERNLSAILQAHEEFVENWKSHCFISKGHPCLENIEEFILLCTEFNFYWKLEKKHCLADYQLEEIEQKYLDCIRRFVGNIQCFEERLVDRNDTYAFFYDEIMNNIPIPLQINTSETSSNGE